MLKPLLKPDERRARVEQAASELAAKRERGEGRAASPPDVIRYLAAAADAPKKSGSPKKSGPIDVVATETGTPVLRIERQTRKAVTLTLLPRNGATRADAQAALATLLDRHWPSD
jgi:ParB family chromosome partitioning protein